MDFAINDESGVLIEGFDREPLIRHPWHPPYYQQRCEAAGLTKAMDLFSWDLDIADRDGMLRSSPGGRARHTKYGITIRKMSRRALRKDIDEFAKVYNAAWSKTGASCPTPRRTWTRYTLDISSSTTATGS